MKRFGVLFTALMILSLVLAACGGTPPEETVPEGQQPAPVTGEETQPPAGEATQPPAGEATEPPAASETQPAEGGGEAVTVQFWSTDNEEDRIRVYEDVAQRFMDQNPNVTVQIVPVDEAETAQRLATAQAANQLPAIIRVGIERLPPLAAAGILDEAAAQAVIESIGVDEFREGPLRMVTNPATGGYTGVPYDGWLQAIWYRTDVFEELGLQPPLDWETINAACDQLTEYEEFVYSVVVGTDPAQNYGHQLFEQVALSNNAWPLDESGNVTMNTPEMVEALQFYSDLARCSAPGPQYWRGARESYELGQSGMMFYSTYIMDDLVEGSEAEGGGMVEIAVEDLPQKTGFAPTMQGPAGEATYGQLVALAIMQGAPPEAQDVVEFFLTEGYVDVLELAPFGKVPVTNSAASEWKTLSPYFAEFEDETLDQILNGYDSMQRWLFRPEYTEREQAIVGEIENRLLIPQAISNIVLEGNMTPETAAEWLQQQVEQIAGEMGG